MAKEMINALLVHCLVILIWIAVAIITDWSSVFYRKHIIYKKRMQADLAANMEKLRESTISLSSAQLSVKKIQDYEQLRDSEIKKP